MDQLLGDELYWDETQRCLIWDVSALALDIQRIQISDWNAGLGWSTESEGGRIEQMNGLDSPGLAPLLDSDHPAIAAWRTTIPDELLKSARAKGLLEFSLLRAMSLSDKAQQIFARCPLLLTCMVEHYIKNGTSAADFINALDQKDKRIMAQIGLNPGRTAFRVLAYFEGRVKQRWQLDQLTDALQDTELLDTIKHEKELSFDLLGFVRRYKPLSNSTLSKYYSRSERPLRSAMNATIGDIFRLAVYVEGKVSLHEIRKCSSLEDLEWIHDRLMRSLNQQSDSGYEGPFPTPPLNRNEHIVAIENGSELRIEGRCMRHCIYSYLHEILAGRYYAFRVLWPERATLGVWIESRGSSQRVRLDQIKGRTNTTVTKQTEDFVTAWISGKSDRR